MITKLILAAVITNTAIESVDINSVKESNRSLFQRNLPNAIKVEKAFMSKGFGNDKCMMAIHANTWHESKWDPTCKSGNFVGMFQIGGKGTMGQGTTVAQRKDIEFSVNLIASRQDFMSWYKKHKYGSSTVAEAAKDFAANVLRCARKHVSSRGDTARRWNR